MIAGDRFRSQRRAEATVFWAAPVIRPNVPSRGGQQALLTLTKALRVARVRVTIRLATAGDCPDFRSPRSKWDHPLLCGGWEAKVIDG